MPSSLKPERQNLYMYTAIILACTGFFVAAFNISLIFAPNGRHNIASPATSAWAGINLIYTSITAYLGLRKLFMPQLSNLDSYLYIFKIQAMKYVFYAEIALICIAIKSFFYHPVMDIQGMFWTILNIIPLYFNIKLMSDLSS